MFERSIVLTRYINPLSVEANSWIPSGEGDILKIPPNKLILINSSHLGSSTYNKVKVPSPPPTISWLLEIAHIDVTPLAQIIFEKTISLFFTKKQTMSPDVVPKVIIN